MKEIKITVHKGGSFDIDAVSGFAGTQCHDEIQKIVLGVGAVVDEERNKDEYYKGAPEFVYQNQ